MVVEGYIRGYSSKSTYSFTCSCFLAPRVQGDLGKRLCYPECPVVVRERTYIDCTEDDIQNRLVSPSLFGLHRFDEHKQGIGNVVVREEESVDPNSLEPPWQLWMPLSPRGFIGDVLDDGVDGNEQEEVEVENQEDGGQAAWGEVEEDVGGWGVNIDGGWGVQEEVGNGGWGVL